MPNFIISPYAISWDSIKNQLNEYIQNKSDEQTWKDFYVSGAGETVVEIAAALGAFYAYHFIMGRRENYISSAQNYTSLIGLAQNAGYSAGRGHNLKVKISYVNNTDNTVTINKWDILGNYTEYDIVALLDSEESIVCEPNQTVEVPCVIGNLEVGTDAATIPSNDLTSFSFHSNNATNDLRLILNNKEVPTSNQFKDLLNGKWVIITNPYGCVDAFYLNNQYDLDDYGEEKTFLYKYKTNDLLYVQFIARNNLTWSIFSESNVNLYGAYFTNISLISDATDPESKEQIRLKAPLYHETSMVIRSRKDYSKYLIQANNDLIDANDRDITPGLIELTYLKRDGSLMSDEEIEYWLNAIEESRPSGVARALISHPIEVPLNLVVNLWFTGEGASTTLDDDIDKIIKNYNDKLGASLDLNQLEHDIERLSGIKIARVNIENKSWTINTNYQLYDIITTESGKNFYVDSFNFKSGNAEIDPETGLPVTTPFDNTEDDIVIDNDIIWEKVNDFADTEWKTWNPNTHYNLFDYIKYEKLTNTDYGDSSEYMPLFKNESDVLIYDYHIIWKRIGSEDEIPQEWIDPDTGEINYPEIKEWIPKTIYYKEKRNQSSEIIRNADIIQVRIDGVLNYFACYDCFQYKQVIIYRVKSFKGKSSSSEIEWDSDIVIDNVLCWRRLPDSANPPVIKTWNTNSPYAIGDVIKITKDEKDMLYTVTTLLGTSGNTEPEWIDSSGMPTYDNNIIWKPIKTEKNYSLGWNQYFKLTRIN